MEGLHKYGRAQKSGGRWKGEVVLQLNPGVGGEELKSLTQLLTMALVIVAGAPKTEDKGACFI